MSDVFALDPRGQRSLEDDAQANPFDPAQLPVPAWQGAGQQFKALLRPSASAGRTVGMALGGLASIGDTLRNAATGGTERTASDWVFRNVVDDVGQNAVDYWTPDASTSGAAANTIGTIFTVAGSVPQIVGAPGLFLADAGLSPATDVIQAGGSVETAGAVGMLNLGANAIGMRLPAAWGSKLATRLATGAGANVVLGGAQNAASREYLEQGGLADMAASYDPLNPQSLLLDTLMGAAFGAAARGNASPVTPSQRDAVLTARNADSFANRTLPGEPRDAAAALNHQAAMDLATQQLEAAQPVNVSGKIDLDSFDLRPELQPHAGGADYSRMLVALESGGRANAKAATSSATGLHQFTDGTWLATVRKARPAWAQGLDDAQILAQRTDAAKSTQMELALRGENAAALRRAGQDAGDAFNLYAAHHFGSAKGVAFAQAASDTPMREILTKGQLDANPYLRGLTKGEAIANWTQRARRANVEPDGGEVIASNRADLSEAERSTEAAAIRQVLEDEPGAIAAYERLEGTDGGRITSVDEAREIFDVYSRSAAGRTANAVAVHEPASHVAKANWRKRLAEPVREGATPEVIFTAGGTGAGKTSVIRHLEGAQADYDRADLIYDGNLQNPVSAQARINEALATGRKVSIWYVNRDPVEAFRNGVLPRANKDSYGRTVPLEGHIATHLQAAKTIGKLAEVYKDHPDVDIRVLNNAGEVTVGSLADVAPVAARDYDSLREDLTRSFDEARESGTLKPRVADYYAENVARIRPQGDQRSPDGSGDRRPEKPEQAGQVVESPLTAAQRVAADAPDLSVIAGFDADGNPRYASMADALADIEAERAQGEADAAGITAAANCFLRRGDAS